jgi:hypothetical protein
MVEAYHPGTGHKTLVPASAMQALRQSGWLLASEHAANEEAAAQQAAKAAKDTKTAPKSEEK